MIEIPIIESVAQELVVPFGSVKYRLELKYNDRSQLWTIGIIEEATKVVLIQGLALVLGQELLKPYNFGIGKLMVNDNRSRGIDADYDDFNDNCSLIWIGEDE